MFKIADDEVERESSSPLRLKKLFVLSALLVEKYHDHIRQQKSRFDQVAIGRAGGAAGKTSAALAGLLEEDADTASMAETRILDRAWHKAEAYHLFLTAQRQLYAGYVDAAMKTALVLRDFEDVIGAVKIHSLLALTACSNRSFGTASKAFIRLESEESFTPNQRKNYEELALEIFTKHSPKDSRVNKVDRPSCEALIPDWLVSIVILKIVFDIVEKAFFGLL